MEIYTIGFAGRKAAEFFGKLRQQGIKRLIDVRLNNTSQLAGFTKKDDLKFFLKEICQADYIHEPLLAPTDKLLDDYKKKKCTWNDYELVFKKLMTERQIDKKIDPDLFKVPDDIYYAAKLKPINAIADLSPNISEKNGVT